MEELKKFEPLWGSWYVKELIGEGGYGKVYKIEREEFGEKYFDALKYIKIPRSQSEIKSLTVDMDREEIESYYEHFVKNIVKEFSLMSKLKGNSNIVSCEDYQAVKTEGKIEWNVFIRMELLTSLIDYMSAQKMTKRIVIKLGIDICKALELCQKYNIIHRDIKPENIFVSKNGDFKLGDFGIARQIEATATGLSKKGTFPYIAPEVYKGEAYGSTVDIYSLGLVMYRLLNNNRMPFVPPYPQKITHTDRELAFIRRIKGDEIPAPVNGGGRLGEIVLKACAYDHKDRYENPTLMRRALEQVLYSEAEASDIYPDGDSISENSVEYVDSGEHKAVEGYENKTEYRPTETMALSSETLGGDRTETMVLDFEAPDRKAGTMPLKFADTEKDKKDSVKKEKNILADDSLAVTDKSIAENEKAALTENMSTGKRMQTYKAAVGIIGLAVVLIVIIAFVAGGDRKNKTAGKTAIEETTELQLQAEAETNENGEIVTNENGAVKYHIVSESTTAVVQTTTVAPTQPTTVKVVQSSSAPTNKSTSSSSSASTVKKQATTNSTAKSAAAASKPKATAKSSTTSKSATSSSSTQSSAPVSNSSSTQSSAPVSNSSSAQNSEPAASSSDASSDYVPPAFISLED